MNKFHKMLVIVSVTLIVCLKADYQYIGFIGASLYVFGIGLFTPKPHRNLSLLGVGLGLLGYTAIISLFLFVLSKLPWINFQLKLSHVNWTVYFVALIMTVAHNLPIEETK